MALRFKVANQAFSQGVQEMLEDGQLVLTLDERNVASFKRFAGSSALADDELLLRFRMRNGQAKFATNAFFFQEGHAERYQNARFGEFRVGSDGEAILTRMRDENLVLLGAEES